MERDSNIKSAPSTSPAPLLVAAIEKLKTREICESFKTQRERASAIRDASTQKEKCWSKPLSSSLTNSKPQGKGLRAPKMNTETPFISSIIVSPQRFQLLGFTIRNLSLPPFQKGPT